MKKLYLLLVLCFGNLFAQHNGFYENRGQIVDQNGNQNTSVLYLLNTKGLNVQLRKNGFSYDVYEAEDAFSQEMFENCDVTKPRRNVFFKTAFHRVDVDFVGSDPNVSIKSQGKSKDFRNYYTVKGQKAGVLFVHHYQKVLYENLYPNIDLVFFVPEDQSKPVEYNFVIKPGANLSDIKMKWEGTKTKLENDKLSMRLRFGKMEESLPKSWIGNEESGQIVDIRYRQIAKNTYGFSGAQKLNANQTITIDPVPVRLWGTYYGGTGQEIAIELKNSPDDNVYVSAQTASSTNLTTAGSHQQFVTSWTAAFISKFDPDGQLLWGTYFDEIASHMAFDTAGNLFFGGSAFSPWQTPYGGNLSTPGTFQPVHAQYSDAYLVKMNPQGVRQWGTFYGGMQNEDGLSIAIDNQGYAYLCGQTNSETGLASTGAFMETSPSGNAGSMSAFLAKFDHDGQRLWGTYYGGATPSGFMHCGQGADGGIYAIGSTAVTDNIATPGTYQPTTQLSSGMIIKFTTSGQRIWGTYMGGEGNDWVLGAEIKGNFAYLQGRTWSETGIGTPNTFYPNFIQNSNIVGSTFIIKFDLVNQQKIWGTYFPTPLSNITVNASDELYGAGPGTGETGLGTPDAYLQFMGTYHKNYIVKLNLSGQRVWGTYYGGNMATQLGRVSLDSSGAIYMFGNVNGSTTGIATPGAHQSMFASNPDTYLAKFLDCNSTGTVQPVSDVCVGGTISLHATGGTSFAWLGPNGFSSNLQNPEIQNATPAEAGEYTCAISGLGCDATITVTVNVGDSTGPVPDFPQLPQVSGLCSATVSQVPTATDNCAGTINGTTIDPLVYDLPGTYTVTWTFADGNGNSSSQNQTVVVAPNTDPIAPQVSLSGCDDDPDGKLFFDLTQAQTAITPLSGYTFSYYKTLNEAILQTGAIGNLSNYENETNPQALYVRVENGSGCSSVSELTLNVFLEPNFTDSELHLCDFAMNGLQIFDLTQAESNLSTDNNLTFAYFTSLENLENDNPIPNASSFSNTINPQTIWVEITNANGCSEIAILTLHVDSIALQSIPDLYTCDDDYDGFTTFNLYDTAYTILPLIPSGSYDFDYYLSVEDALAGNGGLPTSYTNTVNPQPIFIRVQQPGECPMIFKTVLNVIPKPRPVMKTIWSICSGSPAVITADSGYDAYSWSTGQTTQSIVVSQPGNYSVTVFETVNGQTCEATVDLSVVESNSAIIEQVMVSDWTDEQNSITVVVSGLGDYEYSLDNDHFQDSNVFTDLPSGQYTVYVRDKNGCGTKDETVYLLTYPKFFTPNGDGSHDFWRIKFSQIEPTMVVNIFDRYGKFLCQLEPNGPGWDGTLDGKPLPSTDYWFTVTRADGKEHKGHFSLKR